MMMICLTAYRLLMGYLMPKFNTYMKIWFSLFFNVILTPYAKFTAKIKYFCKDLICFIFNGILIPYGLF